MLAFHLGVWDLFPSV